MGGRAFPGLPIDTTLDRETLLKIWNHGRKVPDQKPPKAFYKYGKVHIHIDDLRRGVLAHEMAHHIINTYFLVRPPTKTTEILAQYVERMIR